MQVQTDKGQAARLRCVPGARCTGTDPFPAAVEPAAAAAGSGVSPRYASGMKHLLARPAALDAPRLHGQSSVCRETSCERCCFFTCHDPEKLPSLGLHKESQQGKCRSGPELY